MFHLFLGIVITDHICNIIIACSSVIQTFFGLIGLSIWRRDWITICLYKTRMLNFCKREKWILHCVDRGRFNGGVFCKNAKIARYFWNHCHNNIGSPVSNKLTLGFMTYFDDIFTQLDKPTQDRLISQLKKIIDKNITIKIKESFKNAVKSAFDLIQDKKGFYYQKQPLELVHTQFSLNKFIRFDYIDAENRFVFLIKNTNDFGPCFLPIKESIIIDDNSNLNDTIFINSLKEKIENCLNEF